MTGRATRTEPAAAGQPIAVVGAACRFPDADDPAALWDVVRSARRTFRPIPPERLRLADYGSEDPAAPDRTYARYAAVLRDYAFARQRFQVGGVAYRSTDLVHWLALDVATDALADAGFPSGDSLPAGATGVIVGNTLTGERSRANSLRLRWPHVRRALHHGMAAAGVPAEDRERIAAATEEAFKAPFAEVTDETLAGSLSNTIAGRICNHYDLHGGGYTVDAACAASLLAVMTGCSALTAGDLDVAVVGGVDLSLDPFELVGFAKAGALARGEMLVYDEASTGFWPGEGCGFLVLMRLADARARGRRVHAVIEGWGLSSDGAGGITRPEAAGQLLAMHRAYARAGVSPADVALFEGHGTGTAVGDDAELDALSRLRRQAAARDRAALGSVKANIGHTKAAAGIAGLLKAMAALEHGLLPPTTGCRRPHPRLQQEGSPLRVLADCEPWPDGRPRRAAVSAMGFGGVNTHVVMVHPDDHGPVGGHPVRERAGPQPTLTAAALPGDPAPPEPVLLGAGSEREMLARLHALASLLETLSFAELPELARALVGAGGGDAVRLALVAANPLELRAKAQMVTTALAAGRLPDSDSDGGILVGVGRRPGRVGFLFPGQASPTRRHAGAWAPRFPDVRALYTHRLPSERSDASETRLAQPAIIRSCRAGLAVLHHLGVRADVAVGHSLGELAALHWAGAYDGSTLERLVDARAAAMGELPAGVGAMAQLAAPAEAVSTWLCGTEVVVAAHNGPRRTVVAGPAVQVEEVVRRAGRDGVGGLRLPVSHAFHSPLMAAAAAPLGAALSQEALGPVRGKVWSTVTGRRLDASVELRDLLVAQLTAPVAFAEALEGAASTADILLEVGPGQVVADLARAQLDLPVHAVDAGADDLAGLVSAIAGLHAAGAAFAPARFWEGRGLRALDLSVRPRFLSNPCETLPPWDDPEHKVLEGAGAPATEKDLSGDPRPSAAAAEGAEQAEQAAGTAPVSGPAIDVLRGLLADRLELPVEAIQPEHRLLADLHLSSIAVAQLAAEAAQAMDRAAPPAPGELTTATVHDLAAVLEDCGAAHDDEPAEPDGVRGWVRAFTTVLRPAADVVQHPGRSTVLGRADDPLVAALREGGETSSSPADPQGGTTSAPSATVVVMPDAPGPEDAAQLVGAAAELHRRGSGHLVLVERAGRSAAGVARSLRREAPGVATTVIQVPADLRTAVAAVTDQVGVDAGHRELVVGTDGSVRVPVLEPLQVATDAPPAALSGDDLLLVTGGGKGIATECALEIGRRDGAALILMGRSDPHNDRALRDNLARFEAAGVRCCYVQADVVDAAAVRRAVERASDEAGAVTAVIHAAGVNTPRALPDLDHAAVRDTLAPKVDGLRNVAAALGDQPVRLLVTFSSIIARIGLPGQAAYALANAWMEEEAQVLARRWPGCRTLNVQWSVWSGAGMGERLGVINSLARQGVWPIPVDEGVAMLRGLLATSTPATVLCAGRFGRTDTVRWARPSTPLRRFVERTLVDYPGVELVVEAELSVPTDPYLEDHVVDGVPVLPGVMTVEAAAQLAERITGATPSAVTCTDVAFGRAVTVPPDGSRRLRLAGLRTGPARVEVAVRSDETGFAVDHAHLVVDLAAPAGGRDEAEPVDGRDDGRGDAGTLLAGASPYPVLAFHGPSFQRVEGYHRLRARSCGAVVRHEPDARWFSWVAPSELVVGDPGARDAALHAVQACVPDRRLLPVAIERLWIGGTESAGLRYVSAVERARTHDGYVYDIDVRAGGTLVERWEGVTLRSAGALPVPTWPSPFLGPFLERALDDRALQPVGVAVGPATADRREGARGLATAAAGRQVRILHATSGRPELDIDRAVSVAYAGDGALVVTGPGHVACDVEQVVPRSQDVWRAMLGQSRSRLAAELQRQLGCTPDLAATAVWVAGETFVKAGRPIGEPMLIAAVDEGTADFKSGPALARCWVPSGSAGVVIGISADGAPR